MFFARFTIGRSFPGSSISPFVCPWRKLQAKLHLHLHVCLFESDFIVDYEISTTESKVVSHRWCFSRRVKGAHQKGGRESIASNVCCSADLVQTFLEATYLHSSERQCSISSRVSRWTRMVCLGISIPQLDSFHMAAWHGLSLACLSGYSGGMRSGSDILSPCSMPHHVKSQW